MALLGQASGGFTESSSSLRILHLGIRNTVGVLCEDAFTQSNPPVTSGTAGATVADNCDRTTLGVLSGSIAFARPDGGANQIGGPASADGVQPIGCFINNAAGNSFENTPGVASGKGPYVSAQGTYGNALFETKDLSDAAGTTDAEYATGDSLVASVNGYLTNISDSDNSHCAALVADVAINLGLLNSDTDVLIGVLKMPADSTQDELVYDQRI